MTGPRAGYGAALDALAFGVPRLPSATVSRPRLLRLLDEASAPLVLLRGPQGIGKTVLLTDWARRRGAGEPPLVWLTLDGDLDTSRTGLRRAVVAAVVDAGLAPDAVASPAAESRAGLVRFFRSLGQPLVVVLDGLEAVQDHSAIDDLEAVLRDVDSVRCIAATRRQGPLEDPGSMSRLDTIVIPAARLVFTLPETAAVVSGVLRRPCREDRLAGLQAATAGHPGAVVAAARATVARGEADPSLLVDRDGQSLDDALVRNAVDYVRAVLVATLGDTPVLEFLRRVSVVGLLPARLAARLGGVDDATPLLDTAWREGAGVWLTASRGATGEFRLYPVIRQALGSELAAARPALHRELLHTAATWSLENDLPLVAVESAAALLDMPLLSTVLRRFWTRFSGRYASELVPILGPLPRRRTYRHPVVLAMTALAYSSVRMHQARAAQAHEATIAAITPRLAGLPPADRVFLLALDAQARRRVGDVDGAIAAADAAAALLPSLSPAERDELGPVLPFIHDQIGVTYFFGGDDERALSSLALSYAVAVGPDAPAQQWHSLGLTALIHALLGDVTIARTLVEGGAQTRAPGGMAVDVSRAVLALEDFRPDEALRLLADVDPVLGSYEHWPVLLMLRANATIALGRATAAAYLPEFEAQVVRFRLRSPAIGVMTETLAITRARLLLAVGRVNRADSELELLPGDSVSVAVQRAAVHLLRGDARRAHDHVVAGLLHSPLTPRVRSELTLMRAVVEQRLGRTDAARVTFAAFVDGLVDTGLRSVLLTVPRDDLEALVDEAAYGGDTRARDMLAPGAHLAADLSAEGDGVSLSDREAVVLRRLASDLSLPEVSRELHVSVNTVKTQLRSIYRKLGVSGRREAVDVAHKRGLIGL
ncbi:LuxR C-terminal-related transcriptional regulator [Frigoribacterium sp. 2-23]|uniref:helix-turn-helix transcriptional regulator n=1 Tax=Frigoribacterium sp. 2-23 TaxID=3415006 RepID=UPI003C6F3A8B